jgi:Lon protease-like protein
MKNNLPNSIPIFPLTGVIYFPKTNLPLNIFEQRYIDLVNDTVKKDKLMGMVQSKKIGKEIYKVGCLGKISDYKKSDDGRILINLTGLTRFEVLEEIESLKLYREFKVEYKRFHLDLSQKDEDINTDELMDKAQIFFRKNGLLLNWKEFNKLDKLQRVNTLAMIAPVNNEEKQKLLESVSLEEKVENLLNIIKFYLHDVNNENQTIQ